MNDYLQEVKYTALRLEKGEIILHPTDTIWGFACDAFNEQAVQRMLRLRKNPPEQKAILLVSSGEMIEKYAQNINPRIHSLNDYHEQPVTVIYPHPVNIPDYLLAQDGSVAMRIVKDDFCAELIHLLGRPILSTGANLYQTPYPSRFSDITEHIKKEADYIVKHRQQEKKKKLPSVIVQLNDREEFDFIRT